MAHKPIRLVSYRTGKSVMVSRKTADRACGEAERRLRAQERIRNQDQRTS